MQNKDSVVLHHMGVFGGSSVRLTDITVEGDKVVMTAEHGAKLSLLLEHCVGGLGVEVPPNGVVLSYCPGINIHPYMGVQAQPGMGMPSASSRVEGMVGALFQHELTARLIEPLRETARKMEAGYNNPEQPAYATGRNFGKDPYTNPNSDQYWATNCNPGYAIQPPEGWNVFYPEHKIALAAEAETIASIEVGYPTTHIVTDKTSHDVRTAKLFVRPTGGLAVSEIDNFSAEAVIAVERWLKRWGSAASVYRVEMNAARRWVNPSFTDSAGETHVINHAFIQNDNGVITFGFFNDKRTQVKLEHLDTGEAVNDLLVFNKDVVFSDEKVIRIYQILSKLSSTVALNYLRLISNVHKTQQ